MAKNDFIEGFLHGLYNAGIGNPAVNEARAQRQQDSNLQQAELNAKMAGQGMIPGPQQPQGVASAFKNFLMPGSQGPQLQTAFVPNPKVPKYYQSPTGDVTMATPDQPAPQGAMVLDREKGATLMAEKARTAQKTYSPEQYDAIQSGDPAKIKAVWPNGIPADVISRQNQAIKMDPNNPLAKAKQINDDWSEVKKMANPFRSTGMGGASSVFNKAATANQAAARGLAILNKPTLTWKELNAYVNSDIATIQRGGGSPTDMQLHEANYNTLLGHVGNLATFVTGKPTTGLVPPETVAQVRQNIMDIINVDNQIIDDGIGYVESSYPEAIAAHKGTWDSMKTSALKIKTVGGGETPSASQAPINDGTAPQGQSGGAHPQDSEAVTWAKAHPLDSRAQKILSLNGVK